MSPSRLSPGQIVDIKIERLASGGSGVARHDGFVIFVPLTAPQEKIKAKIETVKKSFATASLIEILEPSPERRPAPCPYYGECGGCNWQHVNYSEQLKQKEGIVRFLTSKVTPELEIDPIEPSPSEWRYRNRIQIHATGKSAGFLRRSSHQIIDINDCLIAEEKAAKAIPSLKNQHGKFEIGLDENKNVYTLDLAKQGYLFTQVNRAQNQKMIDYVLEKSSRLNPDFIFDLYCGSGNFTFPLAQKFPNAKVIGVEEFPQSIEIAKSRASQIPNVNFLAQDTAAFIKKAKHLRGSLVVLDPPRAGCAPEVLDALIKNPPAQLIYVSCDPATASRDWLRLKSHFRLQSVKPFDMFPQTDHVELISVLTDPARLD